MLPAGVAHAAAVAPPVGVMLPAAVPVAWAVALPAAIRDAMVAQAIGEAPNEMCGFIVGTASPADGGVALRWEPARNAAASPLRFDVAPDDLVRIFLDADDRGEAIWAVVHSHVRSPAVPSGADIAGAAHADALHVLVSLAEGSAEAANDADEADDASAAGTAVAAATGPTAATAAPLAQPAIGHPSVRAWHIAGGDAREVALTIDR